ncbi:MAG: rubrerythrin, partial [Thermotogae bacterium]
KIAIELEKDSVIYYYHMGIKQVVPESLGKEKVDSIIEEEMSHITLLNSKLPSL